MESQAGITSERHTVYLFNKDETLSFPSPHALISYKGDRAFPKTSCFLLYSLVF